MEMYNGKLIKEAIDHKAHFIDRIKERYGLDISEGDYTHITKGFKGLFKKGKYKTVGYTMFKGVKVYSLYINELVCLATALPPVIETDVYACIRSCFPSAVRNLAVKIYESYIDEHPWFYAADGDVKGYGSWKPSIHMPKAACRFFGEITDINVERLSEISDWKEINGEDSLQSDPWLWVISYKKVPKPENFI